MLSDFHTRKSRHLRKGVPIFFFRRFARTGKNKKTEPKEIGILPYGSVVVFSAYAFSFSNSCMQAIKALTDSTGHAL